MPYLLLGIAGLIAVILVARWFATAEPAQAARVVRWGTAILAVLLAVYLAVSGRWGLAPVILFGLLPWLMRGRAIRNVMKNMRGPTPGKSSNVDTRYLRMVLDHDSGDMQGEVLSGTFAGRSLDTMSLEELMALLSECMAEDEQSAQVLAAYLERKHPDWRQKATAGAGGATGPSNAKMTREEAAEILGIDPKADSEEIKEAHRRLMTKMHPDHGGSTYLASKINQAKEVLLGG